MKTEEIAKKARELYPFNEYSPDAEFDAYIKGHEEGKAEANAEWQEKVRWINVEERLPERNVNVEIKRSKPFNQYILTAFQRDGVFYSNETGEPFYNATHYREIIE